MDLPPPLRPLAAATRGTPYDGRLFLVGGAVRDPLLGQPESPDFDLVTELDAPGLARWLYDSGLVDHPPAIYPRFGTAQVRLPGAMVELVTARAESYDPTHRKPDTRPASLHQDALRRDFTVNTLLFGLHSEELIDPLGRGLADLYERVLRTPLEPEATFFDDPLRMLRAVRFRHRLGFRYAPGLAEAIRAQAGRLEVISAERIRDEFLKMLHPAALEDLAELGLLEHFAPELLALRGVEQGSYHHLDVWGHSLLVMDHTPPDDPLLRLAALLHDVGKPATRTVESDGRVRFFGHEQVGAEMARALLTRLRLPNQAIDTVTLLVRQHMRLSGQHPVSPAAARRFLAALGDQTDRLLDLMEADGKGHRPGMPTLDIRQARQAIASARLHTPPERLRAPLSGAEVMALTGLAPGPEVGRLLDALREQVLEGILAPDDAEGARAALRSLLRPDA